MQNAHTPNVGTTINWNFQGKKWTIAKQGNIVAFLPANFQHLTNNNIDFNALLQAAAAHGIALCK
jgi:glutathione peroxidase-family protein